MGGIDAADHVGVKAFRLEVQAGPPGFMEEDLDARRPAEGEVGVRGCRQAGDLDTLGAAEVVGMLAAELARVPVGNVVTRLELVVSPDNKAAWYWIASRPPVDSGGQSAN